ncbi:unnamed protein product [Closterium sp. NIES-54]
MLPHVLPALPCDVLRCARRPAALVLPTAALGQRAAPTGPSGPRAAPAGPSGQSAAPPRGHDLPLTRPHLARPCSSSRSAHCCSARHILSPHCVLQPRASHCSPARRAAASRVALQLRVSCQLPARRAAASRVALQPRALHQLPARCAAAPRAAAAVLAQPAAASRAAPAAHVARFRPARRGCPWTFEQPPLDPEQPPLTPAAAAPGAAAPGPRAAALDSYSSRLWCSHRWTLEQLTLDPEQPPLAPATAAPGAAAPIPSSNRPWTRDAAPGPRAAARRASALPARRAPALPATASLPAYLPAAPALPALLLLLLPPPLLLAVARCSSSDVRASLSCPSSFSGASGSGQLQLQRRPRETLTPQQLREWYAQSRGHVCIALSTADPSLFLRTDTSLTPFYILVYVDDLVFATADTEALALVKSELQKRHTCTDLGELRSYLDLKITRDRACRTIILTQSHMVQQVLQRFNFTWSSAQATPLATGHSLSAPPSDESVEPSGPYPELVGCLMYLMTCTRPDLAYPLGLLARYMAPGRHRKVHMDAAKRVLRYLCSTYGMGLVLGGRSDVVLTGHSDASWVDDLATQRSSQGYTFSLGSGSVSWRSTRSSSVLSSSCEAEIYATVMAAQELRWLTYLLTDLGERPRSPPVLYVDNKAANCLVSGAQSGAQNETQRSASLPGSRVAAAWSASSCSRGHPGQHC